MKLLVLNGPNLNLLGQREPEIYGDLTLHKLEQRVAQHAEDISQTIEGGEGVEVYFFQSNHEGVLVDTIQNASRAYDGIIYNPAAHTHYSIALRDAIAAIPLPVVEVHLSDIATREAFRRISVMSDVCVAQIKGLGVQGYIEALDLLVTRIIASQNEE